MCLCGCFKGVPDYLFSPLYCLTMLYENNVKSPSRHVFLPSISPRLAVMTSFLSTYRFLSLFALYFPALITSFSLFQPFLFQQTEKYHSLLLALRRANNSVGSFPVDSPRQTHTHTLSGCYLKSHCAHKDKPQQPHSS